MVSSPLPDVHPNEIVAVSYMSPQVDSFWAILSLLTVFDHLKGEVTLWLMAE